MSKKPKGTNKLNKIINQCNQILNEIKNIHSYDFMELGINGYTFNQKKINTISTILVYINKLQSYIYTDSITLRFKDNAQINDIKHQYMNIQDSLVPPNIYDGNDKTFIHRIEKYKRFLIDSFKTIHNLYLGGSGYGLINDFYGGMGRIKEFGNSPLKDNIIIGILGIVGIVIGIMVLIFTLVKL